MPVPEGASPGEAFRYVLTERRAARLWPVDARDYADLPQEDRDDLEAAAEAAVRAWFSRNWTITVKNEVRP